METLIKSVKGVKKMYCQNCGKELRNKINYCPACGNKIVQGGYPKAVCSEVLNSETTDNKYNNSTVLDIGRKGKKHRSHSFKIIITIVFLFVVVAISIFIMFYIHSRLNGSETRSDRDIKTSEEQIIGQSIVFGRFEQDGDLSNGQENLNWIIVCKEDDMYLLLCSKVIYCGYYSDETTGNNWENCLANKWLNTDFLMNSFTNEEKINISQGTIHAEFWNNKEDYYNTEKVFIFSLNEINYFSSLLDQQLYICEPTKYATQKSNSFVHNSESYLTEYNGMAEFWLRTSGTAPSYDGPRGAMGIQGYGDINSGIRPAIWVNSSFFD